MEKKIDGKERELGQSRELNDHENVCVCVCVCVFRYISRTHFEQRNLIRYR
jgi:hypothetical protein